MKIVHWLDENIEKILLSFLSIIMIFIVFLQVVMRYVFKNSLHWSEEIARFSLIWLVFIGISYAVKKNKHIKIDVLLMLFKSKGRILLNLVSDLLFLLFALFVVFYGFDVSSKLLAFGQKSPANHIPMGYVYAAAPVGFGLAAIRLIQSIIQQLLTLSGKRNATVKTELEQLQEEVQTN